MTQTYKNQKIKKMAQVQKWQNYKKNCYSFKRSGFERF
jgi:hypothetical protein